MDKIKKMRMREENISLYGQQSIKMQLSQLIWLVGISELFEHSRYDSLFGLE